MSCFSASSEEAGRAIQGTSCSWKGHDEVEGHREMKTQGHLPCLVTSQDLIGGFCFAPCNFLPSLISLRFKAGSEEMP